MSGRGAPDGGWGRRGAARVALVAGVVTLGSWASAGAQGSGAYRVEPVSGGATLAGQVTFEGAVPRARRFLVTKDVEVCGVGYRERAEVEVSGSGGLRNVVVIVEGVEAGKGWPERPAPYEITQRDCVFAPHLQVIPKGVELDILNPDPVLHNIHGFEAIGTAWRTLFNLGQPPERETITHPLRPRRGNQIRLECDAHDFMLGWIYAADTPYAVAVDADGRFTIGDVPPGTYTVTAWHPYLGVRQQQVTLGPGGRSEATFTFSPA